MSVVCLLHGRLLAKSANVSRRFNGALPFLFVVLLPPLHSRKISVNCASELLLRRCAPGGGDVLGGDAADICADESLRPPSLCLRVDSSNCSRTMSSQPLPPCHIRPT